MISRFLTRGQLLENSVTDEIYERFRAQVIAWLKDLLVLIQAAQEKALEEVIEEALRLINEPFLFVVVGEIKAGKSSFINALLNADICQVDPAPCTDNIQQIVYSPRETKVRITPHHIRIGLPSEVLEHLSIVDTPGTNTVIDHHHELTEGFIPHAGLVIFVFPAKNPHTRTAWDLLGYIRDAWRKRVVFVLQQSDLATEKELAVNSAKVREYAQARGIDDPLIFAVSAKWELENDPRSGFDRIRGHIRQAVTGGRHLFLKLSATLSTGEQVLKQVHSVLQNVHSRLCEDRHAADEIAACLEAGSHAFKQDVVQFADALCERYDRIGLDTRSDFEEGLSIVALYKRAIRGALGRKKSISAWLEELQNRFESRLSEALEAEVGGRSWQFTQTLQDLAAQIDEALSRTLLFREGRAKGRWDEKQFDILSDIRRKVGSRGARDLFHETLAGHPAAMPSRLISGGALTVLGALMLTAHASLLDITGGILASLGLTITGGVLVAKRGKLLKEFSLAMQNGRDKLRERIILDLEKRFEDLHGEISNSVRPFLDHIGQEEERLSVLMDQGQTLQTRLQALSRQLDDETETSGNR
jgi:hypothetical protein